MADRDVAWKVRTVTCSCGENIWVYPAIIKENWVSYSYFCKKCNRTGPWVNLAKAMISKWNQRSG